MAPVLQFAAIAKHRLGCRRNHIRSFINVRIKWVRDPYLDFAVEREKNLKPLISLKNLILSQPSQTFALSAISRLKPVLHLPTAAERFIRDYPLVFKIFSPPRGKSNPLPHVKVTSRVLSLHHEEALILGMSHYRLDVAQRLAKLLMMARCGKLPLWLINLFRYDLGLPHDYLLNFLVEFPEYFQICEMGIHESTGEVVFGLELVSWKHELAISEMQSRRGEIESMQIRYSMNLPRGFDLQKKVLEWMENWHSLPYISPYENALHLAPSSDHSERWAVAVVHEVLSLLVSKKTERNNLFHLADFLGIGRLRFKKALVHFPGIFYVSNKIRTQTVVLREKYSKNLLIEKHPLMDMRNKYLRVMNLVLRRGKPFGRVNEAAEAARRKDQFLLTRERMYKGVLECNVSWAWKLLSSPQLITRSYIKPGKTHLLSADACAPISKSARQGTQHCSEVFQWDSMIITEASVEVTHKKVMARTHTALSMSKPTDLRKPEQFCRRKIVHLQSINRKGRIRIPYPVLLSMMMMMTFFRVLTWFKSF